ncbi:hypothetical protein B0H11DRAFT_2266714 [Mycena galericulata]|nr:hypothetical protein B0H11DRAFT_2266714 [Mycena galericulata]
MSFSSRAQWCRITIPLPAYDASTALTTQACSRCSSRQHPLPPLPTRTTRTSNARNPARSVARILTVEHASTREMTRHRRDDVLTALHIYMLDMRTTPTPDPRPSCASVAGQWGCLPQAWNTERRGASVLRAAGAAGRAGMRYVEDGRGGEYANREEEGVVITALVPLEWMRLRLQWHHPELHPDPHHTQRGASVLLLLEGVKFSSAATPPSVLSIPAPLIPRTNRPRAPEGGKVRYGGVSHRAYQPHRYATCATSDSTSPCPSPHGHRPR